MSKRVLLPVAVSYEALLCDCGTQMIHGKANYMSSPVQKDFACPKCGKSERLSEESWPGLRYEVSKECKV
jgi:predicted RNA-binding Zn-ribbon protein involved in translation (DUF1610 family)